MKLDRETVLNFKRSGKYRCPNCQHERKKNKHDTPLSVTVKTEGVVYFCHHCNINGGEFYGTNQQQRNPIRRKEGNKPQNPHRFKMRKWDSTIW
jgi:uncharacterized Zn finger protein (UPF0148 family)